MIASQHSHREAILYYHKLTPSIVNEKNWNTKEDKSKTMMHVLYVLRLAKRHVSEQSNIDKKNSEKIKPIALCYV